MEALVESLSDLARREYIYASSSQLDRERDAVQPAAYLGNVRRVIVVQRKACVNRKRAINE